MLVSQARWPPKLPVSGTLLAIDPFRRICILPHLPMPSRMIYHHVKLTLPATNTNTNTNTPNPVILSHGHGASKNLSFMHGYSPLANFWATHLASKTLNLQSQKSPPGTPSSGVPASPT
ncbi:hypothetical protein ASPCADRAFT_402017 [Aspergillus carbonarius ITEM 5010]|uniref:Uncharacterized protein n=1 Tax=Aspergillus carbonarius (strain ITEM 5010) TaxID=602072 RepID=A0A1R3S302_ASPC5|nr:hypothetical protein ASPCADRAFT_402017 [Aspergillus carbonarius ITEM 5010]